MDGDNGEMSMRVTQMGDAFCESSSHAEHMTNPQIPTDWHPLTYAVDEHNKVVWKQSSHAVAMGLAGNKDTLISGCRCRPVSEAIKDEAFESQTIKD